MKFIIPFIVAALLGIVLSLPSCTAQQQRQAEKVGRATTQAASDPVLQAVAPAASGILRIVGESILGVVTILSAQSARKHRKKTKRVVQAWTDEHPPGPSPALTATKLELGLKG